VLLPEAIAIASRNPGKIGEILAICADWPVRWITAEHHPSSWPTVEETGETYLDNALLKANAVADALSLPAISDDSGIEVDALEGAPGPLSARFAGPNATDQENLRQLIDAILPVPESDRTARYRCVATLSLPEGSALWAEGTSEGRLITEPRGTGGFGYDPVFVPQGEDRTMAELSPEEKNRISHRARAFRALREKLAG
jgi:XTP/dITP diphosphohydrolase